MPEPPSVGQLLDQATGLPAVLARAEELLRVQRALREAVQEGWVRQLRVADLRGGVLVLHTDHAAMATRARQQQALLAAALKKATGLDVTRLDIKVKPPLNLGAR